MYPSREMVDIAGKSSAAAVLALMLALAAPARADDARARLEAAILAEAKDFCREVHDAEGSLLPTAITAVEGSDGADPDLAVHYTGFACDGVESAPLKQGGFCGLTTEGMQCQVKVFRVVDGDYVEVDSYLEASMSMRHTRQPSVSAPGNRWGFDPAWGLAGKATVIGSNGSRLQVECGNGGAPAFWIQPDPRPDVGEEGERVTLIMDVDGQPFHHEMDCGGSDSSCFSHGFPDPALVDRMRLGTTLTLLDGNAPLAAYSLAGSNAAISRLAECLEY